MKIASEIIGKKRYQSLEIFLLQERTFFRLIALFTLIAAIAYPYPQVAMWVGFMFAAYSAIANDSIQTIGTFIASNSDRKWWQLWLFIGSIFVFTVAYSWVVYDGDVSYQRLTSKGFSEPPTSFHFLQVGAPIILLILTRMRMPVSTTFMLLSAFSSSAEGILSVTQKSLTGYLLAFVVAMIVWFGLDFLIRRIVKGRIHPGWRVGQWIISGMLWSMWIMHDAANIAIFLPRSLSMQGFLFFTGFIFFGLGLLFYMRGDKIQSIITEKSSVTDVRSASIIDFVYAIILFVFKEWSTIPMSTTWVFLGLLGGRELAIRMASRGKTKKTKKIALMMIGKDLLFATIGLFISIVLAIAVNPDLQNELMIHFGWK